MNKREEAAARRQCPKCGRKSALVPWNSHIYRCQWDDCRWESDRQEP